MPARIAVALLDSWWRCSLPQNAADAGMRSA
jgi:hypothetical protein